MLKKFTQTLWALFLFTFPFSLRFVVYEQFSYRFGHFSPWVTGFIYLPEVLLGVVFILWLFLSSRPAQSEAERSKKIPWHWLLPLLFIINAGIITYLNGDIILFGFFLLRIVEAAIIYLLIKNELLPAKTIIKILLGGAAFQLILGYLQWQLNHSLGLRIIGEPLIAPKVGNVAKINLEDGLKQIRPYGTFLHPNIFAAYLMSILFIKLSYLKKYHLIFWLVVLTGGIYFTASLGAQLITLVGFGLIILMASLRKAQKEDGHGKHWFTLIIFTLLMVGNVWFFQNSHSVNSTSASWQERLDQNTISRNMFFENPLGVGTGNFTLQMEDFAADKLLPWHFQPVHNTYFLILNETGIQGLILLILMIGFLFYHYPLTIRTLPLMLILLIAPFDHFLWDSFMGMMLMGIILGFNSLKS